MRHLIVAGLLLWMLPATSHARSSWFDDLPTVSTRTVTGSVRLVRLRCVCPPLVVIDAEGGSIRVKAPQVFLDEMARYEGKSVSVTGTLSDERDRASIEVTGMTADESVTDAGSNVSRESDSAGATDTTDTRVRGASGAGTPR